MQVGIGFLTVDGKSQGLLFAQGAFFVALIVVVVGQLVLTGTVFGRYLIALGTNEEEVRLSGIDPRPRSRLWSS